MTLTEEVKEVKKDYITDNYSMSIGEIIGMYKDEEIIINPEFQRFYRWNISQKTRFIESLLLGIPTPSIFVYQRKDGVWELVDGLQRVSTILEFVGELKDLDGEKLPCLELEKTSNLTSLEKIKWINKDDKNNEITNDLKLQLKRERISIQIIQKESDPHAKFDVFERLNTGGSFLSPQEVRNSLMVMMNIDFLKWLEKIANNDDFLNCISISERLFNEQYHLELVLRYLSCTLYDYEKNDVSEFLTNSLKRILANVDFDKEREERIFNKLFKILNSTLSDDVFTKFDGEKFKGKFLESAFEAITFGLKSNIDSYNLPNCIERLKEKIEKMWNENRFTNFSGSGSNARTRIPKLIEFGKEYFKNV